MKKFIIKKNIVILFGALLFVFNVNAQLQPITVYFSGNDINTLVPFVRGVAISTPCGQGVREITTDLLGRKASEIDFCNGRRCGLAKIYKAGVLIKEINYLNDYVISYKSYENGVLVTEINADRSRIVAHGTLLPLNWKRIYVKFNRKRIVMISKKTFIDNILRFQIPENVVAILKDMDSKAGMNGVSGANAIFNCDESFSKISDLNINLHGSNSVEKSAAKSFINNLGSTCSAITKSKLNDDFNGKKGDAARDERKAKAISRLDNMISACQNRANSPGMFENPIIIGAIILGETIIDGAAVTEGAVLTAEAAAAATEVVGNAIIESTILEGTATALTNEVAATTISEVGQTAVSSAVDQTLRSLPALTESVGTEAADIVTAKFAKFVMTATAVIASIGSSSTNASEPPMEICQVQDDSNDGTNGMSLIDDNQGQSLTPPKNPSSGSAIADEAASDNCARLKRFRDYCNNNGWQTLECQDAIGILTGCGTTDPRVVYVSPEGEPAGSGCYDVSKAQAAALECKKRSLIASTINGNNICPSKGGFDLRNLIKDPGWYDPSPIDGKIYHNSLSKMFKGTKITVLEGLSLMQLQSKLTPLSSQILVVFMDPDCPASRSFAKILNSNEVSDAIQKGINIVVVDAAFDPAIASNYNLVGFPTSFIMNSKGKLSIPMLGALTIQETVTAMLSK